MSLSDKFKSIIKKQQDEKTPAKKATPPPTPVPAPKADVPPPTAEEINKQIELEKAKKG